MTYAVRNTQDWDEASSHQGLVLYSVGAILTITGWLLRLPSTEGWEPSLQLQCIQKMR